MSNPLPQDMPRTKSPNAGGICDNLLTCIVRAWDYRKQIFIAPPMNTFMWENPFTERHLMTVDELGMSRIPPVSKRLACGDYGNGAMAEPSLIYSTVRLYVEPKNTPGRVDAHQIEPGLLLGNQSS